MSKYSWHCCTCGQFVSWSADSSTYYGNSYDVDPPDPDYYCVACAEKCKTEAIERGYVYNVFWIEPRWQIEAKNVIAHQRDNEHRVLEETS